jgi:hypothetical protein
MNKIPYKAFKKYGFWKSKFKEIKNYNSYRLMKIMFNFNHSKVHNYQVVKVFKERVPHMHLSFHNTSHIESPQQIWNENQYLFFHFVML